VTGTATAEEIRETDRTNRSRIVFVIEDCRAVIDFMVYFLLASFFHFN
jgi:hypothetical protein